MGNTENTSPQLEERFLEPEGWRWHNFKRPAAGGDRKIRFGSVFPKDSVPDAVVVCLPGLSEFAEKYYETARTCLDHNLAFWTLDWYGQGGSERYLKNRQKRHGVSFDEDVEDFRYFITEYVKHACVHPDVGRIPLAMLGHSMGATIGLKYLQKYPDMFECAGFVAPLMGLERVKNIPIGALLPVSGALRTMGKSYIAGGSDWKPEMRPFEGPEALCTDPE
ncbi:MAG: alpha/beta fold hydrolase, partial [Alphaproteobacteria bacterium]|nr:alpha/beta fold hydrolase [Alphaproteobacteria bacterium]